MQKIFYEGVIDAAAVAAANANGGQPNALLTVSPDRRYVNTFIAVSQSGQYVDSNCAEIAFLNVGDGNFPNPAGASVSILGFVIKPGFGVSFDGNEYEVDMTKYQLIFSGGGIQNCWVFRKMFA